jgi:hypothetical protein
MCSALAAAKIMRSYADIFEIDEAKFINQSEEFEELACQILKICSEKHHQDTTNFLLLNNVKVFEEINPLEMAILARAENFVFQDGCKNLFNHVN